MDAPYKVGATVRQKVAVIEGPVQDMEYDKSSGAFRYLVGFVGSDGEAHARWFGHDEIVDVEAAAKAEAEAKDE